MSARDGTTPGPQTPAARRARIAVTVALAAAIVALVATLAGRSRPGDQPVRPGAAAAPTTGSGAGAAAGAATPATRAGAPAAPTVSRPRVAVAFQARWGSGPAELGRTRPAEGNPEGPMAFAVDRAGHVVVLDQVNGRLQRFAAGAPPTSVPLPAVTFQDLDLRPDGGVVLLDRLARRAVVFVGDGGAVEGEVALVGPGVPEGGGVTGLFQRADGTWVEVEHRDLVRVADARGRADPGRPTAPGRLAGDGRAFLRAARVGREAAVVERRALDGPAWAPLARVPFPAPILHLTALEADPRGRVYLAASVLRGPATTGVNTDEAEVVAILGADGAELGRVTLPPRRGPEEYFRPVRLGADGALYQMSWDDGGVTMRRIVP